MRKIKIGIIGIGNCASALIQGITYYANQKPSESPGLRCWELGNYTPADIEVTAAFDIDRRKVGRDLSQAIFSPPNCTTVFQADVPVTDVFVQMGRVEDSLANHMEEYEETHTVLPADKEEADMAGIVRILKESGTEILLNYLPVGSELATRFYAQCALEAGVAFINNIPVFIASDPHWADSFAQKKLPLIGDDIKSQMGATITHRVLANLFKTRGVELDRTYQLNMGGNTDFLNMLDRNRLKSKRISKTEAVQSALAKPLESQNIHIGPSDYVPWLKDNKVCFLRMEGRLFGNVPMNMEIRLSVEDSPNSAGVAIDTIRCCKLALDRGIGGILSSASAYFMKHPPHQLSDDEAHSRLEAFIAGERRD